MYLLVLSIDLWCCRWYWHALGGTRLSPLSPSTVGAAGGAGSPGWLVHGGETWEGLLLPAGRLLGLGFRGP